MYNIPRLTSELQDRIYSKALISPDPITICSLTVDTHEQDALIGLMEPNWLKDDERRTIHEDKYINASKAAVLKELAFGLL